MNLVELNRALRQLRLGGMAAVLETRLRQAQAESMAPLDLISCLVTDELTRRADRMLERIADFLDEEIETTLSGLTALIEPILIVFLGVVVGGMVICMFLPIFKLSDLVSGRKN